MSEHKATLTWKRATKEFEYKTYNREHTWEFEHGTTVPGSAAPAYLGKEDHVDPEQAYVASLASCHMLTFLAIACKKRFLLESYADEAVGLLEKNEDGQLAITTVTLRPKTVFSGDKQPSAEELKAMHDTAHHHCFIANSVKTKIVVELP